MSGGPAITIALLVLTYCTRFSGAGDTEIWPIPSSCPTVDPINYTVHLQHESDCAKFYKCDHGNKVLFECPDQLHFNPVLQVCDWPSQVNCNLTQPTSSPSTTSTLKPTTITAATPTTTSPTTTTEATTSPTTTTEATTSPTTTTTEATTSPTTTTEATTSPTTTEATTSTTTTTTEPTTSPTTTTEPTTSPTTTAEPTPPADRDSECPWPDPLNYTVHLPHESDCTKFYKCDNGRKVEFVCPDDLHFNRELEVCDWPWDAGCEAQTSTSTTESTTSEPTTTPTTTTESTTSPTTTTEPTTTPTTTTELTTTPTTTTEPTTSPTTTTEPTTSPTTTAEPTPPADRNSECPWPDPLNYTVHLPHESDCTKFYKCDNGRKVEFDCPDDLHFNRELEVCDWPWDAGCEAQTSTSTTESTTSEPTTNPTTTTEPTRTTVGDDKCPPINCQNSTIYLPVLGNLRQYIRCVNGEEIVQRCPGSLVFDRNLATCNLEHLVDPFDYV